MILGTADSEINSKTTEGHTGVRTALQKIGRQFYVMLKKPGICLARYLNIFGIHKYEKQWIADD